MRAFSLIREVLQCCCSGARNNERLPFKRISLYRGRKSYLLAASARTCIYTRQLAFTSCFQVELFLLYWLWNHAFLSRKFSKLIDECLLRVYFSFAYCRVRLPPSLKDLYNIHTTAFSNCIQPFDSEFSLFHIIWFHFYLCHWFVLIGTRCRSLRIFSGGSSRIISGGISWIFSGGSLRIASCGSSRIFSGGSSRMVSERSLGIV